MLVLLGGGHDLDVLEGAVCCVVVSVATGNAGAVAHGDRGSGQLRQALVLAVHRQLICKIQQHTLQHATDDKMYTTVFSLGAFHSANYDSSRPPDQKSIEVCNH